MLDKKFFRELAQNVVNMYRNHIFDKGLDYKGKKFKKYSTEYTKAKRTGTLFRQDSNYKNKTSPVLTGDLLRDFKVIGNPNSDGFSFGTVSHGGKVIGLGKLGRDISTSKTPIPSNIAKFIVEEADDYIMQNMKKDFKDKKSNVRWR